MNMVLKAENIPGTVFALSRMNGAMGEDFLDKVFYISDSIRLAQIKEITGVDGTTLQNWLKRGLVPTPTNKAYSKEHLARILILNMMRDTMQLSRILYLFKYLNGDGEEDKIISESALYDYVCRVIFKMLDSPIGISGLEGAVEEILSDYSEPVSGAKKRVSNGIYIISMAYYSSLLKAVADDLVDSLGAEKRRKR